MAANTNSDSERMPADSGNSPAAGEWAGDERTYSCADIARMQETAWTATLDYVSTHSPFYREHFRLAGIHPGERLPLSERERIPTVDKAVLSENALAFLCVPESRVVDVVTTSGSTGEPLIWKLTEADLERLAWNEYHSFRCAGLGPQDTVVLAVTLDRCFIAGTAYFLGLRKLGCAIARVGPATPLMHLDLMQRIKATAIVGVPSFLGLLADKAAESKRNPRDLGLQRAICIGEPVRRADLTLNAAGQAIESRWGARVFSTYGVTELAASFCECGAGQGGHLHPQHLYLEALDDEGRPVPDGEVGELTATTFGVEAMPLVRYRTGDYATICRAPCSCGRNTLRIGPIVGRKSHKLKVKGTTLFPSTFQRILETVPGVAAYVILARSDGPLSDEIEVRVACAENETRVLSELRERFQGEAKVLPRITPASPAEIEALQMPEGQRKRRFFVDLRQ